MSETLVPAGRRRDAAATRGAILEAARTAFAQSGYDHVALREIAADAGADVALIKRYFGGKEGLFVEALKAAFNPDRLLEWDRVSFVRDAATIMADASAGDARTDRFQFLLRAATSPVTAPLLNLAMQERFLAPIRQWLGEGGDAHAAAARARVLAAVYIGLLVERLVRGAPLAGAEREAYIGRVETILAAAIAD